ncbi:MAG: hypothetical protein ACK5TK_04010 [Betaproteobacteria bacterium]
MQPDESLERVNDEATFLAFARALMEDRAEAVALELKQPTSPYGPDAGGWENTSIERFLEAAISWAETTQFGASQGLASSNPWRRFAVFLYCGKIYE